MKNTKQLWPFGHLFNVTIVIIPNPWAFNDFSLVCFRFCVWSAKCDPSEQMAYVVSRIVKMTFKIFVRIKYTTFFFLLFCTFFTIKNDDKCQHITKFNSIFGMRFSRRTKTISSIDIFISFIIICLLFSSIFIIRSWHSIFFNLFFRPHVVTGFAV